jgi:hypothetical protein
VAIVVFFSKIDTGKSISYSCSTKCMLCLRVSASIFEMYVNVVV